LRTNPKDARIAEEQEKWKEITAATEASAAEIVGNHKLQRRAKALLF
jgi:hypothetical protein